MGLVANIIDFFNFLSFVDIIFLIAMILLIILIVTLIYFVKINRNILKENQIINSEDSKEEEKNIIEEVKEPLIEDYNDEEPELIDLKSLTQKLKEDNNTDRISFTEYEKDQEEKAIISYDELLEKTNKFSINYEKEEMVDDISVKKVNLNDLVNKDSIDNESFEEVRVISYQKEEEFLNALKELNKLLN